jgi:capsular polysaccharide biosynthesis protein
VITREHVRKVLRKGVWTAASAFAFWDGEVETLIRRPSHSENNPGDLLVRRVDGPVFVEAEHGYVITPWGRLIEDSTTANYGGLPPWRLELPSPAIFVRDRRHKAVQRLEMVVSLRHWWEWNYYHFYMDVLGKLAAFDAAGIPFDTPIVIGRYYNQVSWVRDLLSCGTLADRRWIVHDEGLIEARSVVYCQARMTYRERAEYIVRALGAPVPMPSEKRRIFLNRRGPVNRQILNRDEVVACVVAHGFEDVDAAALSIPAQMELFANTRHLVAIHGAGLVNVIYRQGQPMSVLELYGRGYNTFDFRNLSRELGYQWHGLECELAGGDRQLANIEVDVEALERYLAALE